MISNFRISPVIAHSLLIYIYFMLFYFAHINYSFFIIDHVFLQFEYIIICSALMKVDQSIVWERSVDWDNRQFSFIAIDRVYAHIFTCW